MKTFHSEIVKYFNIYLTRECVKGYIEGPVSTLRAEGGEVFFSFQNKSLTPPPFCRIIGICAKRKTTAQAFFDPLTKQTEYRTAGCLLFL